MASARFDEIALLGFEGDVPPALREICARHARRVVEASSASPATDAVVAEIGAPVDHALLERFPRLRLVVVYGTDPSGIDHAAAASRAVAVANVPGYSTEAVAEFVFAAALDHLRLMSLARARGHSGEFGTNGLCGTELRGKRLGVLGLGRIGARTAEIGARGFRMEVAYWSRSARPELESALGLRRRPLGELLSRSEVIAVHLPLTAETRGLLGKEALGQIRSGALVASTSPTMLFDLEALEDRLARGAFSFAFDHGDELPLEKRLRLLALGNVIAYPPIACLTDEAQRTKADLFEAILDALVPGPPR